jgi:hypothetical protein
MRLEVTHRFAIPLRDGFDYIVEPRNWPEYWPGLIRMREETFGPDAAGDEGQRRGGGDPARERLELRVVGQRLDS